MKRLALLLALASLVACSDDDSPTAAPGDDLVGTWRGVSSTDPEVDTDLAQSIVVVYRSDGTLAVTVNILGLNVSVDGTWEIVGDKLITVATLAGESLGGSESYTVRGDRLTLVDDETGYVEVWERQS